MSCITPWRSVIARPRAVRCVAFLANSPAIGCKDAFAAYPDPPLPPTREVMQDIPRGQNPVGHLPHHVSLQAVEAMVRKGRAGIPWFVPPVALMRWLRGVCGSASRHQVGNLAVRTVRATILLVYHHQHRHLICSSGMAGTGRCLSSARMVAVNTTPSGVCALQHGGCIGGRLRATAGAHQPHGHFGGGSCPGNGGFQIGRMLFRLAKAVEKRARCRSEGASTTTAINPLSANSCRDRTRKLPSPPF